MHNKKDIVIQSFGDFLSPKVLFVSTISFAITVGIITIALFFVFDNLLSLQNLILNLFNEIEINFIEKIQEYQFVEFILKHKIMMLVIHYLFIFGFGILIYYIFFIIYSLIISFFIFIFIGYIHKKYYSDIELKGINIFSILFFYFKTILITLILFILLIPSYFIPAVNFLIFLPLYYFFHKTIVFDVSSIINNTKEYKKIKNVNWVELKAKTSFCFLISLIPIIGVLAYPFYIIFIGHYIFIETKELRFADSFK
jgi:hypothetical protein